MQDRQDAHSFSSPSFGLAALCRENRPRYGMGGAVGGNSRRTLLTNGSGVCWLREVLGHLPVDVKPAESKGDRGEVGTRGRVS